jgi:uncharacterized FAD-dependent dehydrogenase
MTRIVEVSLRPEDCVSAELITRAIAGRYAVPAASVRILRKSLDARRRPVSFNIQADLEAETDPEPGTFIFRKVAHAEPVHIIGSGPAGLFAAMKLVQLGHKPVLFERGKEVRERRRDLANITRNNTVNPDSNYCFGEGGAGTYSDGKLYTRATKRGDVGRILRLLVHHGADPAILYEAHPHIGTNKLPGLITRIRETILEAGGEVHFSSKLTGIRKDSSSIRSIRINDNWIDTKRLILATGHSARDIFTLLHQEGILIEAKPFALGVRIEHPQSLIDSIQYKCDPRGPYLPPASYSIVNQSRGRGVFSFCMCPGGIIAPAATAPGEIVVNGWSPSKRNNEFANSGMVVAVDQKDFKPFESWGELAGMAFQASVEQKAFAATGSLRAPAQRVMDFVNRKGSSSLPDCSYLPGTEPSEMDAVLPAAIVGSLRDALKESGKKMRGYLTNEAVLVATESRTSSPVRIPRNKETLEHPQVKGLFPCGEGAGYAGGIVSAAIDGERCALAAASH